MEGRWALGYADVDGGPDVEVLLDTMDATAGWGATRELRGWERGELGLRDGQRLLDVGCGLGDAALALAEDLGSDGEVVGVDASAAMVAAARTRAKAAGCRTRFVVGDAAALDEVDGTYDVVRSERTLQWLPDPGAAVAEMVRVVRPGGLVSLIDTDWSTFAIDVGDDDLAARVRAAMQTERARPSTVGRHLADLLRDAGGEVRARVTATQDWDAWDPDASPAPEGCFSMTSLADDLVDTGHLDAGDRERFVDTVRTAARQGRFAMTLTMHAVVATVPAARRR